MVWWVWYGGRWYGYGFNTPRLVISDTAKDTEKTWYHPRPFSWRKGELMKKKPKLQLTHMLFATQIHSNSGWRGQNSGNFVAKMLLANILTEWYKMWSQLTP